MNEKLEQIEALRDEWEYVDDNDNTVLTLGVRATFYFWGGHTSPVRAAVVECVEAYLQLFGTQLKRGYLEASSRFVPFDQMPSLRAVVPTLDEDDRIEWSAFSAERNDVVGDFEIVVYTERGWQEGVPSRLTFVVPRAHAFEPDEQRQLLSLVELFNSRLRPFHSHAGLCAVSTFNQFEYQLDEFDLATRFKGAFIEYMAIDPKHAPGGIKSVDWLTFIGATFAERVGGKQALVAQLQALGIDMRESGDGVLVAANLTPDLIPVSGQVPASVKRVNAALRPLRNGNFGSMAFGGDGPRFNNALSDLWIRRFDGDDIWPPNLESPNKDAVPTSGVKDSGRVSLKTGDRCRRDGRYWVPSLGYKFDNEEDGPLEQVILLPGDVAPYRLVLGPHGELLKRESVIWEMREEF